MGAEGAAPPVVAVVVARRPGQWFEDCVQSLAGQDYEALSVLVVTEDPAAVAGLIAEALPEAHVTGVPPGTGYAEAANSGVAKVEGAAHVLVCHDDVVLEPNAVRLLLEEAYRSNAGLICPKALMCEGPDRLLSVGLGADRVGVVHSLVERGELDQGQHDAVREVFVASGGAVLARTDLWQALGGFGASRHAGTCSGDVVAGELDLSWRAQLAGARVVVAPQAVVRHHEQMEGEAGQARPCDTHRLRCLWSCYGVVVLATVVPVVASLQLVESLWCMAHRRARPLVLAPLRALWCSALPLGAFRRERSRAQAARRRSDLRLWKLQSRGSARVRSAVRVRVEVGHRLAHKQGRTRGSTWRIPVTVAAVLAAVVLFGSRGLFGHLPSLGSLPATAGGTAGWWRAWWDGPLPGSLASSSTSPALAWMWLLGLAGLGSAGFAVHVAVLAPLLVGPLGAFVNGRRVAGPGAGVLAAVAYASAAVAYNAVAGADWPALVAYGAVPWLLGAISGDDRLGGTAGAPARLPWARALRQGLVLAVAFSFVPSLVLVTLVMGATCTAGRCLARCPGRVLEPLVRAAVMAATALVACLPWSWGVLHSWSAWVGTSALAGTSAGPLSWWSVLAFRTGPYGAGPLGWALVVAAGIALVAGRGSRFTYAAQMWSVALAMFVLALVTGRGWVRLPGADVLLCGAAAALAAAVAAGAAAVREDLVGQRSRWRQVVPGLGALAVALAPVPLLTWSASGHWGLAPAGAEAAYPFPAARPAGDYRVLWASTDAASLPVPPQGGTGRMAVAATVDGPSGALADVWPGPAGQQSVYATRAMDLALAGMTTQLGHLLAPLGARYVAVPLGVPADAPLVSCLERQVDLTSVGLGTSYAVFENSAWLPLMAVTGERGAQGLAALASARSPLAVAAGAQAFSAPGRQALSGAMARRSTSTLLSRSPVSIFSALPAGLRNVEVSGHVLQPVPAGVGGALWSALPAGRDVVSVRQEVPPGLHWADLVEVAAFLLLALNGPLARRASRLVGGIARRRATTASLEVLGPVPVERPAQAPRPAVHVRVHPRMPGSGAPEGPTPEDGPVAEVVHG